MTEQEVLDALRGYSGRIQQIIAKVDVRGRLYGPQAREAQELLGALKNDLRDEHKRMGLQVNQASLSRCEKAYLGPTIHEAITRLPRNAAPGSGWIPGLHDARGSFDYYAGMLEASLKD